MRNFLYISGALNNPVIKSQVMNWLEVLQNHDVVFDLMCCIPIHHILLKWKSEKPVLTHFRSVLRGRIYIVPIIRSKNKRFDLSTLIKIIFLFFYNMRSGGKQLTVIQSRSRYNYHAMKTFKSIFTNSRIIYDMRGAAAAEFMDSFPGINDPNELHYKDRRRFRDIFNAEKRVVELSDFTTCVSDGLKEYCLEQGFSKDGNKLIVVPGAADSSIFFFDDALRQRIRNEEGYGAKRVMVYCGSLSHYWHKSELVFQFAARFLLDNPDSIFLCLTKDLDNALMLKEKNLIDKQRIQIRFVDDPNQINNLYNAADFAIVFRDAITTNRVASPTKIAEYLLSGLPMLISRDIGDFSSFIDKNKFGVVSSNTMDELSDATKILLNKKYDRSEISIVSAEYYSKQVVAESLSRRYVEL